MILKNQVNQLSDKVFKEKGELPYHYSEEKVSEFNIQQNCSLSPSKTDSSDMISPKIQFNMNPNENYVFDKYQKTTSSDNSMEE